MNCKSFNFVYEKLESDNYNAGFVGEMNGEGIKLYKMLSFTFWKINQEKIDFWKSKFDRDSDWQKEDIFVFMRNWESLGKRWTEKVETSL